MLILGFFLSLIGFGINKRIWSPSYVFVTCGFAAWVLSLLIQWIDRGEISAEGKIEANAEGKTIKTKENPITVLFLSFGMNPLFLYVLSEFLAIVFGTYGIKDDLLDLIRNVISDEYLVSLTYALFLLPFMQRWASGCTKRRFSLSYNANVCTTISDLLY